MPRSTTPPAKGRSARESRNSDQAQRDRSVARTDASTASINERQRDEETRAQLAAIVDTSDDAIIGKTLDGIITSWNFGAQKMYGYSADQVIGKPVSLLVPTDRHDELPKFVSRLKRGESIKHFETVRMTSDGRLLNVSVTISPIKNSAGQLIGASTIARDITDRKRAEEDLAANEAKLKEAQRLAQIGNWELDLRTNELKWSDEIYRIFGLEPQSFGATYDAFLDAVHPEDREFVSQAYERSLSSHTRYSIDHRLLMKDGSVRYVHEQCETFYDKEDRPIRSIGTVQDITDRKRAEMSLHAASAYARSLIEASLDPLVTINPDGKITDVNQATELVTSAPRQLLIGTDFSEYFTESERAREGYRQVFLQGYVRDYPLAIRHSTGRITDVLYNASLYRDENANVLGVFAAARDITQRKMAEELQRAASYYARSLIEASLDPLVTISAEGKITDVNSASVQATGVPREELIGTDFSDYFTEPDKARTGYQLVFKEGSVRDYPLAIRHRSGRITDVLYHASVYRDDKRKVLGVFAAARDITERKRAEEEIQRLNAELEQRVIQRTAELEAANKQLEAFSYSVSHDLRAPLRAITGFTKILLEDYAPSFDAEGKRVCSVISHEAKRMGELIDDLLTLSRLARSKVRESQVDMRAMTQAVFEELATPEVRGRIELKIGELDAAVADPGLIRQVWVNLLSNALKFTSRKERVEIQVESTQTKDEIIYSVRDNGAGFDMKYADKLFGVFQRLHSESEFEGTGVGLAIVQRVIFRHGGRVWAEGEVDKGATFYFALPRKEEPNV